MCQCLALCSCNWDQPKQVLENVLTTTMYANGWPPGPAKTYAPMIDLHSSCGVYAVLAT
jgi:hypothetical protein